MWKVLDIDVMGEIENNTWSHTRINFICGKAKI